jgi:dTDP-4-dehydrorhamnose reductase
MNPITPRILVTGSHGQLGQEFRFLSGNFEQFEFEFVDIQELDIGDEQKVENFFAEHSFFACVNCAAYTAVDKAESEPNAAYRINVQGAKYLALQCFRAETVFINLSTDYVYHTSQNTPYQETDKVDPKGIYAKSKLEGDVATLRKGGMVIRTSWLYSSFGNNFVKTILRLANEGKDLKIIYDQIGTPTYARDLASAILTILSGCLSGKFPRSSLTGVYHYSNEGVCSWYDFAMAIVVLKNISAKISPIETRYYPTPAVRPPFSVLNKSKIKTEFGLEIPHWQESLRACLSELTQD